MEINLELPSGEQDRLDTGSNKDVELLQGAEGMHIEKNDFKASTTGSLSEIVHCCSDRVDLNTYGANVVSKDVANCEPENGLEFDSKEAAYSYYREYARSVGFGITIKASRRSKRSGKFIDVKIACSRFGSKRESGMAVNPRSCPKTDCKASMHMKRRPDGKWTIYSFIKEHNHEICPDDFYCAIRGKSKQSTVFPRPKKGLQLVLDEADVEAMLTFCMHMQDENPNFLYAIDLDNEKRMRNVFWVDAKGRHDYSYFCDVVFFDTSYIFDKYRVPFVPIIGVNNHFQFILLGCALIGDESLSTFVWLMQTWLRAVGRQAPRVIITDQDKFLKEAVTEVFSETRHCFCLWHVLKKIPENLGYVTNKYANFMKKFSECIYQSWSDEQFEHRWQEMVDEFELQEDEWMLSLYEDRKKWVPSYMTGTFLGGMSTTERAGSIASFFDKYLHKETTFKNFLDHYKAFLLDRYEKEAKADFETRHQTSSLRFSLPFLKQMSGTYTHAIFEKFQVEAMGIDACSAQKQCGNEAFMTYQVDDLEEHQKFLVSWNETTLDIRCLCRSFEYRGFLCRHAMNVLRISGLSSIPSCYILKRWTNYAGMGQNINGISSGFQYRLQRFNDLCKQAIKLGEEGSLCEESYNIAFYALEKALGHCVSVNNSVKSVLEPNVLAHGFYGIKEDIHGNSLAKTLKKKKICKKKKVCPEPDIMTTGMQESCQQMVNSRAHTLENTYVSQDIQGMELASGGQAFDGYYGTQHSVQGVGQLNSMSPIRDGYYGSQQVMQGLGQLNSIPSRVGHYGNPQSLQGLLQGQLSFRAPSIPTCFNIQDSLQDVEQSMPMGSPQFHGIASKHLHDKRASQ